MKTTDNSSEMNAELSERFKSVRHHSNVRSARDNTLIDEPGPTLCLDIRDYHTKQARIQSTSDKDAWLSQDEIPTKQEMAVGEATLLANKIEGPYKSKDRYLKTHHALLREDSVGCLRDAIQEFIRDPTTSDTMKFSVYDQVHIVGFTFARRGVAARIKFTTRRAGRRIKWANSKRLVSGSIVALIPAKTKTIDLNDMVVAVIAARPLAGLLSEPPEIDIYFARPEEIQLDPQKEWLMIEAKQGYFEAYRHTLKALQKLSSETFPMSDHICHLSPSTQPPAYIHENPILDLSVVAGPAQKQEYSKVDVTKDWPPTPADSLDDTQWEALKEILTKRLAIVQGPPGTGKTYVSRKALEILHANRKTASDPPIVIAAQTNHALDQLLQHISVFEPNYVRLGGRSTNPEVQKRALFALQKAERLRPVPGGSLGKASSLLNKQINTMTQILEPFAMSGPDPWSTDQVSGPQVLEKLGAISAQQARSLEDGASQWVSAITAAEGPLQLWLDKALVPFEVDYTEENYGFEEVEDNDLEFEQLRENEDSTGVNDEEDIEMLRGPWKELRDRFTVQPPSSADLARATKLLDTVSDLWKIGYYWRGPVYHVIQSRAKDAITAKFREAAENYNQLVKDYLIGKWEQDIVYLQRSAIIGMTTTGLSKYRPLVAALKPKIILIEEAAEVLEAPVAVACVESLEHLILIGDHQQLQGHCSVRELEGNPFHLNVSLFERLVRNNMSFRILLQQRRMMPEISRLISVLYPHLKDHPSVIDRPVQSWGMGKIKSFFFDHEWWEAKDESLSTYNSEEAKFIAGFYLYLFRNGISPSRITVLTFYNGQRKRIVAELKAFPEFRNACKMNVKTVDSYQGEENDIVILSLARNNEEGKIGFLSSENRTCVALSRAKYGFYLFGNARILMNGSDLWHTVLTLLEANPRRLGVSAINTHLTASNARSTVARRSCVAIGVVADVLKYVFALVMNLPSSGKLKQRRVRLLDRCRGKLLKEATKIRRYRLQRSLDIPLEARTGVGPPHISTLGYRIDASLPTRPEPPKVDGQRGTGWSSASRKNNQSDSLSPVKQSELRKGWKDFAKGGFVADDERLNLLTSQSSPGQQRSELLWVDTPPSTRAHYGPQRSSQIIPNQEEAAMAISDGRTGFLQELQAESAAHENASLPAEILGGQLGDDVQASESKYHVFQK
ncbi:Helicase required for RNAi-mediated heterochromatin assembly 1 [Fonsecaea pedrosoi]|nr:Helicase required for RNAi-mediated heterochromatin assembly 1 [Fonsecaea pedrosoi]